jgi:hypothetical protein
VRPLVVASLMLQRDNNTLADVVYMYISIFVSFRDGSGHAALAPCIEKRWATVEQPLALLAFFLHPEHAVFARKLIGVTALTSKMALGNYAVFYWRRFIDDEPGTLRGDMALWLGGKLQPRVLPSEFHSIHVRLTGEIYTNATVD